MYKLLSLANYSTSEYRRGHSLELLIWPTAWHFEHVVGARRGWGWAASAISNWLSSRLVLDFRSEL